MKGLFALTPLMVFLALYAGLGIITGDIYATPITVVFLIATLYSLCVLPRRTWAERFQV
ncbi:MAG: Na+/H+ antiporter NhaC family protein, partial [Bacteroidaceae bacterium]|nr:Na+/H+ antiporter NhaC family protein [Bacteroidaceae bacterium]